MMFTKLWGWVICYILIIRMLWIMVLVKIGILHRREGRNKLITLMQGIKTFDGDDMNVMLKKYYNKEKGRG